MMREALRIMDVPPLEPDNGRFKRFRIALAWQFLILLSVLTSGCFAPRNQVAHLPNKYEIETNGLILRSDLKIKASHPLLAELKLIRTEITKTLQLPPGTRPIVVHLFSDEQRYGDFMQARHPNLPKRRAFFIGTPTELGIYAHWSPNLGEDLRHEYTHGVLHSSLKNVPLWFDEGLAEYYETPLNEPNRVHREHIERLAIALGNGWRPDLARLEKIEEVNQMGVADYQESWAWIHYLMHDAPDGRELLVGYARQLTKAGRPPRFHDQVAAHFGNPDQRLASYLSLSLTDHGSIRHASATDESMTGTVKLLGAKSSSKKPKNR